jgi:hypothetical protein
MVDVPSILPPPRWPPKLAMVLGLVCLFASGGACCMANRVDQDLQVVEKTMLERSETQGQNKSDKALMQSFRSHKLQYTAWQRRQLGLFLAGLVLLLGGFWGLGLRNLYDKMTWVEIDDEAL